MNKLDINLILANFMHWSIRTSHSTSVGYIMEKYGTCACACNPQVCAFPQGEAEGENWQKEWITKVHIPRFSMV